MVIEWHPNGDLTVIQQHHSSVLWKLIRQQLVDLAMRRMMSFSGSVQNSDSL